jgi:hypothetical protein
MRFAQKKKAGTRKSSKKHHPTGVKKSKAAKLIACVVVLTFLVSIILASIYNPDLSLSTER